MHVEVFIYTYVYNNNLSEHRRGEGVSSKVIGESFRTPWVQPFLLCPQMTDGCGSGLREFPDGHDWFWGWWWWTYSILWDINRIMCNERRSASKRVNWCSWKVSLKRILIGYTPRHHHQQSLSFYKLCLDEICFGIPWKQCITSTCSQWVHK